MRTSSKKVHALRRELFCACYANGPLGGSPIWKQAIEWLHILIFIHMNKFFLLLTLLCLSLSARAHDAEIDGIFYNLDAANKTATVTYDGEYNNAYSGDVVIPETVIYNGITYSVTSVGEWCFYGCSSLTSITIPNSVTSY